MLNILGQLLYLGQFFIVLFFCLIILFINKTKIVLSILILRIKVKLQQVLERITAGIFLLYFIRTNFRGVKINGVIIFTLHFKRVELSLKSCCVSQADSILLLLIWLLFYFLWRFQIFYLKIAPFIFFHNSLTLIHLRINRINLLFRFLLDFFFGFHQIQNFLKVCFLFIF